MNDRLPKSPAPKDAPGFRVPQPGEGFFTRKIPRRSAITGTAALGAGVAFALTEGPRIAFAAPLANTRRDGGEGENQPSPIRLWLNDQLPTDYVTVPGQEDDAGSTTFLTVRKTAAAPAAIKINSDFRPALTGLLQERQAQGRSSVEYFVAGPDLLNDFRGEAVSIRNGDGSFTDYGSFIQKPTDDGYLVCGWEAPDNFNSYAQGVKDAVKVNMVSRFVAALLGLGKVDIYTREGRTLRTPEEQQLVDETCARLGRGNLFTWA